MSLAGSITLTGAGIAAAMSGLAPAALGIGILAGASGLNFAALDKIGLLEEKNAELLQQIAELIAKLAEATAHRDRLIEQLATEGDALRSKIETLQDIAEYYQTGPIELLELPGIKQYVEGLKLAIEHKTKLLEATNLELQITRDESEAVKADADEVHARNEELDQQLADTTNELLLIRDNINREVKLKLFEEVQGYTQRAVAAALEAKLAELAQCRERIAALEVKIDENLQVMESISNTMVPDIENSFKSELSAFDAQLMALSGENEILKRQIAAYKAPKHFPGLTWPDQVGNQIIDHFSLYGVTFDAHTTELIPGGYVLRFKVDRNADQTKLSAEEFNKITNQRGLYGLSRKELVFKLHPQDFLIAVDVYPGIETSPGLAPDFNRTSDNSSLSTVNGHFVKPKTAKSKAGKASARGLEARLEPDKHRERFIELGCHPADEFGEVIRTKFVNRVRICAGSTGGKSPILEMIVVWLAKLNNGRLTLVNPIPGSPKDWFKVPGVVQPGMDAETTIKRAVSDFHAEFKRRRNNFVEANQKGYEILALDEDNSSARDYSDLGKFFKDMYQLSDHANMGFVSAGQGLNVSGLSGGTTRKKTKEGEEEDKNVGNATKLMEEDFQNCTLVLTSEQATAWINKKLKGAGNKAALLTQLDQLNALCDQLNAEEGLTARPKIGDKKKVSPNAYRIALVASPAHQPFFVQLPAYSDFDLDGVSFPEGAKVTSTHWQELEEAADGDRIMDAFVICPECGGEAATPQKPYADGSAKYRCNARGCRKLFKVCAEQ